MTTKIEERKAKTLIRLGQTTTEYLALENEKEKFYRDHLHDMSRETIVSLYLMQERIDQMIKRICSTVDKCNSNEWDFDNEVAILVYDYYGSQIKRGLSMLL